MASITRHPFKVTFPAASIFGHPFTFKRGITDKGYVDLAEFVAHAIEIGRDGDDITIDLHVVVEYGLNLAEVASTLRNRVQYEVERLTGAYKNLTRGIVALVLMIAEAFVTATAAVVFTAYVAAAAGIATERSVPDVQPGAEDERS